jgi:hypothetical protein
MRRYYKKGGQVEKKRRAKRIEKVGELKVRQQDARKKLAAISGDPKKETLATLERMKDYREGNDYK